MTATTVCDAAAVRSDVKEFLRSRPDLTAADIALYTQYSVITIRSYLNAQLNIATSQDCVRAVARVLERAKAGEILALGGGSVAISAEEPRRKVKRRGTHYDTTTAQKIANMLQYCADHAAIGVVTADFGTGKTWAVQEWVKRHKEVDCVVLEFNDFAASNASHFIRQIAAALGIDSPRGGSFSGETFQAVCDYLVENPALLIFDQCETLRGRLCQVIRQIWDRTREAGVGVVLLGAPVFLSRMSRQADLEALRSRVGAWEALQGLTRHEMASILKTEGITDVEDGAFSLWYRSIGGSMRRLMWSVEMLKARHAGKRITERTIAGVAAHQWGMQVRVDD